MPELRNGVATATRFVVRRASQYDESIPPVKGALREQYSRVDERTVNDPLKIRHLGDDPAWWYAQGRNHRVEHGHIKRDFDDFAWFIYLSDLAALLAFIEKNGRVILAPHFMDEEILELQIYDDYVE